MSDTFLVGRLASDPAQRGNGPVTARMVVNRPTKDRQTNEWKDNPSFFDVVAWREKGEALMQFRKGQDVMVHGRLDQSTYTDQNQQQRQKVEVLMDVIGAVVKVPRQQQPQQQQQGYQQQTGQAHYGAQQPQYQQPQPQAPAQQQWQPPQQQPVPSSAPQAADDPDDIPF